MNIANVNDFGGYLFRGSKLALYIASHTSICVKRLADRWHMALGGNIARNIKPKVTSIGANLKQLKVYIHA